MFLPVGYPQSVHPVYARVHVWQFLETFVGSTVSVLCSQAMLSAVGVSSATAAAGGAVAVQWVLKDGIGEIGKLFFIQRFAHSFDSHPKTWKLVGEISSLSGAFVQICTILAPAMFLPLASAGLALRSIHFSIWGVTHMTFTRNFATQGNVGDLVAKDDSQMSVSHLLGVLCGVGLLSLSHAPWFLFSAFFIMGPVHFAMTLALLNAARFEVLNQTKLTLISRQFVKQGDVPGMDGLKPHERWFGEWIKPGEDVPNLKLGIPVGKAFLQSEKLEMALSVLKNDNYLLSYNTSSRTACIVLHKSAGANDIIKAILHSIKLDHDIRQLDSNDALSTEELKSLLQSSHSWTKEKFPKFVAELDAKDWESDAVFWGDTGSRVEWDRGTEDLEGDATAAKPKSE